MKKSRQRVVTDSMLGLKMPASARWSGRVVVVLGRNPGPFTGPGTNTYIIGDGSRRLLLDTGQGLAGYPELLEQELARHCEHASLERILVTHAHADHIGGASSVLAQLGPLPLCKKPWPESDHGLPLEPIEEGDEIHSHGATLRALWTPGHARDHLCFYLREEKALFTGDVILGAGTTVIPRDGDLGQYLASLRRLLDLEMETIYPGHGPAIRNPHRKIREYLAHRALREEQILEGLRLGLHRVPDLVRRIYTDVPEFLHGAAAMSVEAHLRKLEGDGLVLKEEENWVALQS